MKIADLVTNKILDEVESTRIAIFTDTFQLNLQTHLVNCPMRLAEASGNFSSCLETYYSIKKVDRDIDEYSLQPGTTERSHW